MLIKVIINHLSKLESIIVLPICKIEYVAIQEAEKKIIWQRYLLIKLEFQKKSIPVILYANN